MRDRVIVALDVSTQEELEVLLNPLLKFKPFVKVGMELFYTQGPDYIRRLKEWGLSVFLDIKLHDIPTTVQKAMRGIAKLDVDIINCHAAGGAEMMRAAITGLDEGTPFGRKRPTCIAVTQLTSTDQVMLEQELLIQHPLKGVVKAYGELAYKSGLDGVVCSAHEASLIKQATSTDFITVTPGIRLAADQANDQKRIATPGEARRLGSDYIVVGRSITQAADPVAAYERVTKEWSEEYVQA
ncbi:orotidine-5'-phosphate decarboxylase [Pullulanibacillus pueri]|uniref:Orotidine 5'-phosphate decarboxylase n=1 Tax=Pullulanibacillus pueri TaxID=1437324 RepID=A0A8J3EJG7_9BACL|nr:orotidine-5'-phosphate decarboxylase [Pullulanibacillus pueri]MBM7680165.1 orotidine-5'-phosphate decarboxylase [Pullulanibacillus pueri]GGH74666.1 orotidine 5'-phosphate decarboxylase [Pullulanibacillus pueri]